MADEHKADKALLSEIKTGANLKHADTAEKNPLPSVGDISQEKTVQAIGTFDKGQLKHTETTEKTAWREGVLHEKATEGVSHFDKSNLKHAETEEKNPLPDKDAIAEEKKELEHRKSIGDFDKSKLKRRNTQEKCVLPDTEDILLEKQQTAHRASIDSFDKSLLKRRSTNEKVVLPSVDVINQEKQEQQLRNSIGAYDRSSLKKVETCEGEGLKEIIAQEKAHHDIENFSKDKLKHAQTAEKNPLPSKEDIAAEKKASK